jgi:lipopolysaccharide export LptBFGC system permease protein LptF
MMPNLTPRQLLRRHVAPFAISFASLTVLLLVNYAAKLSATTVEALLLAVPFTVAMTIPMSIFVAVLWVFSRLGEEGARPDGATVRRLLSPVLLAALGVGALMLVWTAQIVPRANARLASVLAGRAVEPNDRTMTIGELRIAERNAEADRAAGYEVEIQKKFALAAACVLLALAGAAIPLRFPNGGAALVMGASVAVFGGYYVSLVAGETLANRLVVSPFVGMWTANAILLAIGLLFVSWRRFPRAPRGVESSAIPRIN